MLKVILFDFDGVIDNNYELHYELMEKTYTGISREEHRVLFEGNIKQEIAKIQDRNTGFDLPTPFSAAKMDAVTPLDKKEILERLSKKYTLGIITSARENPINVYLENNGMSGFFSFVRGIESGVLKSEKISKVLEEYKISPSEAVMITDTLGDILEAAEVGVPSIGFDGGYHERERLQKGNPFSVVSSFSELSEAIDELDKK